MICGQPIGAYEYIRETAGLHVSDKAGSRILYELYRPDGRLRKKTRLARNHNIIVTKIKTAEYNKCCEQTFCGFFINVTTALVQSPQLEDAAAVQNKTDVTHHR